jgi:hypothetical protein
VAEEDPDALAELLDILEKVGPGAVDEAVSGQRRAGVHWSSIGDALGTSASAAHQRWADKIH